MTARRPAEDIDRLFGEYRETGRRRVRNELVEAHIGFAHHVAGRFRNRGIGDDDLEQIALLALVKAVDRFDPDVGAAFTTYAGRTIEGEIKRHFRDAAWAVRVPRSAKETHLLVRRANDELGQSLGRSPTVREVAAHLDVEVDEVVAALATAAAFSPDSLDSGRTDDEATDRTARLASDDARLEATAERVLVERLLESLPEREQEIVRLRFFDELTQSEIAERVGVSQMHVSRLLRRSFELLRRSTDSAGAVDEDDQAD